MPIAPSLRECHRNVVAKVAEREVKQFACGFERFTFRYIVRFICAYLLRLSYPNRIEVRLN